MPFKPKKPCAYPGCPELIEQEETYCEKHKSENNQNYNEYIRDSSTKKKYGNNWKRMRDAYIRQHPVCERCLESDKIVPATEVHHKIPLRDGGSNTYDNLQSLCHSCHMYLHSEITRTKALQEIQEENLMKS